MEITQQSLELNLELLEEQLMIGTFQQGQNIGRALLSSLKQLKMVSVQKSEIHISFDFLSVHQLSRHYSDLMSEEYQVSNVTLKE